MLDGVGLITQALLWLNKGIYWFAEKCYTLLMDIANFELFTETEYAAFGERIYVLLGVVMLFKLAFSFITYIVNPDTFSDKEKGAGKLILRIAITLVLLVATPFIFAGAMSLQNQVLKENIIPNFILGMGSKTDTVEYGAEGEEMAFLVFSSFFRPNPVIYTTDNLGGEGTGDEETDDESEEVLGTTASCNATLFIGNTVDEGVSIGGAGTLEMRPECAKPLDLATGTSFDGKISEVVSWAYTDNNMNILTDSDLIKAKSEVDGEKVNTFEFHGLIALVAGGFLAWIMFMFCFDVAIRTVKLAFLQLIAPIPIISYADPKSNKIFKSWLKQCMSTYFDLFIRLIGIFFAVFVIQQIADSGIVVDTYDNNNGFFRNSLILVFIIFGALLFAKQLPKLISDITGVKFDGGFTLSPINKVQQVPLVGMAANRATARIAGGITAARNDTTGHRIKTFFEGGSAAAHEMKGKIPMSGLKPGTQTVRSVTDSRKIGYKYATGSEMKTFSPMSWVTSHGAVNEVKGYKDEKKKVKGMISEYENQAKVYSDAITSRVNELRSQGKTIEQIQSDNLIQQYNARKDSIDAKIRDANDLVEVIDNQVKDLKGRYANIDESDKKTIEDARAKVYGQGNVNNNGTP